MPVSLFNARVVGKTTMTYRSSVLRVRRPFGARSGVEVLGPDRALGGIGYSALCTKLWDHHEL